jgi:hypothetical protein
MLPEPLDGGVRIQVTAPKGIDFVDHIAKDTVDPLGQLEQLVAVCAELLAVPEDAAPPPAEE